MTLVLEQFLSSKDAERASGCFEKLSRHDTGNWALTGGLATELYHLLAGQEPSLRALNDIDFITDSFDYIPVTLADDFLFRHVHPADPPGKTLLQAIDPNTRVRIDVFRAFGKTMSRTVPVTLSGFELRLISIGDLVTRAARLALDLSGNVPTPAKHAHDLLRILEITGDVDLETAWQDQRKPGQPQTFNEAEALLRRLIPERFHLLTVPDSSKDVTTVCGRCTGATAFPLADPATVMSLLGYC